MFDLEFYSPVNTVNPLSASHNYCHLLCLLPVTLKVIVANSVDPDQTAPSDLGPHCLPICKNRFEKFARIFSRRHTQTTFSDAGFLGVLRVKVTTSWSVSLLKLGRLT